MGEYNSLSILPALITLRWVNAQLKYLLTLLVSCPRVQIAIRDVPFPL